ncbi:Uncharacterised protein [uncultured archaeon]|nr:Uncharacterised protein [uncultured archaeon]
MISCIDKSRTIALIKYLKKLGMNIYIYDELDDGEEIEQMKLSFET